MLGSDIRPGRPPGSNQVLKLSLLAWPGFTFDGDPLVSSLFDMDAATMLDGSLREVGRALRNETVTAQSLTEVALERARASRLEGYRVIRADGARAEAAAVDAAFRAGRDPGPLAGIPVSVKDLFGLPGERVFAGTPKALPERFERAGPVLAQALRQMCVVVGKTHTVEFAFGGIGMNAHWGTPRNPRDANHHRVPGGSTSGAGPSLFEGSAKVAFGTDTAGSVRIPAAWTGHVGLKTTKGRWSTEGVVPLSTTLDTVGVLTRSVEDAIYAFGALDGGPLDFEARFDGHPLRSPAGLRLAVAQGVFQEDASPGVMEAVEAAVRSLERSGARVQAQALPGAEEAYAVFSIGGPTAIELHRFLSVELPDWLASMDPVVSDRIRAAGSTPAGEYLDRLARMEAAHAVAMRAFDDVDVYLSATVARTPPLVSDLHSLERYRRENVLALRNTGIVSFLGLCAVSLPCGKDNEGLPVGLQLIGPAGREREVLAVASAVENVLSRRQQN